MISQNWIPFRCCCCHLHCPKSNMILHITKAGAIATEYVWLLFQFCYRNQTYNVASAPTMTGSVSMQRFRLFLGQCIDVCQCSSISKIFSPLAKLHFQQSDLLSLKWCMELPSNKKWFFGAGVMHVYGGGGWNPCLGFVYLLWNGTVYKTKKISGNKLWCFFISVWTFYKWSKWATPSIQVSWSFYYMR